MATNGTIPVAVIDRHWKFLLAVFFMGLSLWGLPGQRTAFEFSKEVRDGTAATYAILRAINAGISLLMETSLGAELVGSVEVKPAMVLDPLDETVARVSNYIFVLAVISVLASLVLDPHTAIGIPQVGMFLAALGCILAWMKIDILRIHYADSFDRLFQAIIKFGLIIGLVLPMGFCGSALLGEYLLQAKLDKNNASLAEVGDYFFSDALALSSIDGLKGVTAEEESVSGKGSGANGLVSGLRDFLSDATDQLKGFTTGVAESIELARDSVPSVEVVKAKGDVIFRSSLEILSIYLLQLVVFPVLTLALLVVVIRHVMRP